MQECLAQIETDQHGIFSVCDVLHVAGETGLLPGFGNDFITNANFEASRALLTRLSGKFVSGAWVDLPACNVGQNLPLLHLFRRMWNVGIVAGRGYQNNVYDMNLGFYQIVTADGQETTSFAAP